MTKKKLYAPKAPKESINQFKEDDMYPKFLESGKGKQTRQRTQAHKVRQDAKSASIVKTKIPKTPTKAANLGTPKVKQTIKPKVK